MITGISTVVLLQHDLAQAIAFYTSLGLSLVIELSDKWAEFKLGESQLALCPVEQELPERRLGVILQGKNLKKWYEQLPNKQAFILPPTEKSHGVIATIKDPGGNIIDLYEPLVPTVEQNPDQCTENNEKSCPKNEHCCQEK